MTPSSSLALVYLFGTLPMVFGQSSLWEYPGYYWKDAYANADSYWLSVYADDCDYIMSKWTESDYSETYDYNSIECSETLNHDFDNAIDECEDNSNCFSMLLQIFYEDHENNIDHWGDHVAYLYKTSASLLSDSLTIANWTTDTSIDISATYIEKNEEEPLLVDCHFVTTSLDCNAYDAYYLLIPTYYYDNYYNPSIVFDSSYNESIYMMLSDSEYIYQECDINVLTYGDLYASGLHYCIKSQQYTLITSGSYSNSRDETDIDLSLYLTQFGNTLSYVEVHSQETLIQNVNVTDSSTTIDNDDCDLYQQTSYFSWIGDGTCDGELNKYPCWDGGDCCSSTCVGYENSELSICGERGYHCLNPNASDYYDYLDTYSLPISLAINSDETIDVSIDSNDDLSLTSIESGFYITVIDHTSGVVSQNTFIESTEEASQYIEFLIPFQQFVIVYGYGSDDNLELVSLAALEMIGLDLTDSYESISDLNEKSFVFLGRKGGNSSIPYNSYVDNINLWKAFSYDSSSFFQDSVTSAATDISATLWLDEGCEFGDLAYRYYVLDDIGLSTFNVTGDFEYFDNSYACATSNTSYGDIVGKIAVSLDWSTCNTSLKITNAQYYGAIGIVIINTRNDGKPNIVWYENESQVRDIGLNDINIPVLSIGVTDGTLLYESLFEEENTWRTGVEIYKYPNYTISHTRRCAAPEGLYEIAQCIEGEEYYYDNCTLCECKDGSMTCETDDCLDSRQSDCDSGLVRVFTGKDYQCCGRCVYPSEDDDDGGSSNTGSDCGVWCHKHNFTEKIAIVFFGIVALVVFIAVVIIAHFQKDQYSKQTVQGIVAGTIVYENSVDNNNTNYNDDGLR